MKDREIVCRYYEAEGICSKGHAGTFLKSCQKCKFYVPLKGAKPRRTDKRAELWNRIERKENKNANFNYD